jgi:hypothetical protein
MEAGFADVANPYDATRIRRVSLRPPPEGSMEALVLWTRDPGPLLPELDRWEEAGVRSLWLVTLTGYPGALELRAPPVGAAVESVRALARVVGAERVVWRYDPLFLCPAANLTAEWHVRNFGALAESLRGATRRCVVSLYDDYAKARRRLAAAGLTPLGEEELARETATLLLPKLLELSGRNGIEMASCCEDLAGSGIFPGACIDANLLGRLWGSTFPAATDVGQRPGCRCAPSVDIGAYDTCTHGCLYCYATGSVARTEARRAAHAVLGERLA